MNNPSFVIEERIKEINNHLRRGNNAWHKAYKIKKQIQKEKPSTTSMPDGYGDTHWYHPYEDDEKWQKADVVQNKYIRDKMRLDDERRYLRSILKRAKDKKYKLGQFGKYYG